MKAALRQRYGSPDPVELSDVDVRVPSGLSRRSGPVAATRGIERTNPLRKTAAAIRHLEALHSRGKVARGSLIVSGDAAASTNAITASEALWRWWLGVHLSYLGLAMIPWILVPALIAELSLGLWLTTKGVPNDAQDRENTQ